MGSGNLSGIKKSDDFTSKYLAMAACPNKYELCGTKFFSINSSNSSTAITVTGLTEDDTCHYIVKMTGSTSECKYPVVKISGTNDFSSSCTSTSSSCQY